jgi:Domain of unknown function (DUF5615)
MSVALYMDAQVHSAITEQWRRRGVDVLTAQDDDCDNLGDEELLSRSTTLGRVMFTFDVRFKARAEDWQRQGRSFAGLVWGHPMRLTIGQMVLDLELIAKATDLQDWQDIVERLPL